MALHDVTITTKRGITCKVWVGDQPDHDASAVPIVYFHGATGLLPEEPMLEALSGRYQVYAPVWPGYGEEAGEESIEDMLDFALHGWDIVDALERGAGFGGSVHLVGHSMGAMIAAEMAAIAAHDLDRLVLVDPMGLWLGEHPIPDIFAMLPFEFPDLLFADVAAGTALLAGGLDFGDPKAIEKFTVDNSRRLGTAGKILFPVPNRRLSKRLYRVGAPTLLLWGAADKFILTEPYSAAWQAALPQAELTVIDGAGHMLPLEQPAITAKTIQAFLG